METCQDGKDQTNKLPMVPSRCGCGRKPRLALPTESDKLSMLGIGGRTIVKSSLLASAGLIKACGLKHYKNIPAKRSLSARAAARLSSSSCSSTTLMEMGQNIGARLEWHRESENKSTASTSAAMAFLTGSRNTGGLKASKCSAQIATSGNVAGNNVLMN